MAGRLLKGDQIEPVTLLFLDHARGFDHELVYKGSVELLETVKSWEAAGSGRQLKTKAPGLLLPK